jgi:hypothetical protein
MLNNKMSTNNKILRHKIFIFLNVEYKDIYK